MALMLVISGILTVIISIIAFAMPSIRNLEKNTPDHDEVAKKTPAPGTTHA
jgi:hypothetical protein